MKRSTIIVGAACVLAVAAVTGILISLQTSKKGHAAETWWQPTNLGPNNGPEFQWLLGHPPNMTNSKDLGLSAVNAAGTVAPNPTVYDTDGIETPAATVAALHQKGAKAICYIEVGAAGNYYDASTEGIPTTYYAQLKAAGDLAGKEPGYSEYYLKINNASTVSIIESMIKQQCAAKGFDAVEPDIDDSYTDNTGFALTEAQNITFDQKLAAYTHSLGLAWGQKNGDNDPEFSQALEPTTDFVLDESCRYYDSCSNVLPPYVKAGKLAINVEYTDTWGTSSTTDVKKFCPADIAGGIDGIMFHQTLAGWRRPCQ